MLCAFCYFGPNSQTSDPRDVKDVKFIIDGQGVCADHTDNIAGPFGKALNDLWDEHQKEQR